MSDTTTEAEAQAPTAVAGGWRHNPRVIDLMDASWFAEHGFPHQACATLRREHPVYWNEELEYGGPGFWNLTRYKDIQQVSRDPATFSSAKGINIFYPPELGDDVLVALVGSMITMDPPLHNAYRQIALPFFTKPAIAALGDRAREITTGILDRALEQGDVDFMNDVAAPLPISVLCELLGVPDSDRRLIFDWSNTLVGSNDPDLNDSTENAIATYMQVFQYGRDLIEDRRKNPRDDLMTAIATATPEDGQVIPDQLLNGFFLLMVIAGNETTRNSISGGMEALFTYPDEWRRLKAGEVAVGTAIEEVLRWVSPVNHMRRTVTRETEIRGVRMEPGDKVVMWYPAANRDEEIFEHADRFDVGRDPNPHLAFGYGQHFCLGAQLGKLQLRVMFEELLRRVDRVEPLGPVPRIRTNFLNAIKEMPVRLVS